MYLCQLTRYYEVDIVNNKATLIMLCSETSLYKLQRIKLDKTTYYTEFNISLLKQML